MELKNQKSSLKTKIRKFYQSNISVSSKEFVGLHSSIRLTLLCGRYMGLLPLTGLRCLVSRNVRLTLRSFYTLYYMASIFGQIAMFITTYLWIFQNGITVSNSTNAVFYLSSFVFSINLLNIARKWPMLLKKVENIESNLPPLSRKVQFFCNITMVLILLAAIIEHLLSVFYGFTVANSCDSNHLFENYYRQYMPWIFDKTTFTVWKGILVEIINTQSTFIWTYMDLIIMNLSIYLTEHFRIHNRLLEKAINRPYFSCEDFRMQYLRIVLLVRLINKQIGIYIVTCFGSNLYWICTQLFFSLNKSQTGHFIICENTSTAALITHKLEHTIYFTFSFSFIVMRMLLILLLASRIRLESMKPVITLYKVERFIGQIKNIKVALSGLDFFYVTKTKILTLLGTIITYELVLLQFNWQGK